MIREQGGELKTIESQLKDARRHMDRLWRIIETSDEVPTDRDIRMRSTRQRRRHVEASKE